MTASNSGAHTRVTSYPRVCSLLSTATYMTSCLMIALPMTLKPQWHLAIPIGPLVSKHVLLSAVSVSKLPAAPLLTKLNSYLLLHCLSLRRNSWQSAMLAGCASLFIVFSGILIYLRKQLKWLMKTTTAVPQWEMHRNQPHAHVISTLSTLCCVIGWNATSSSSNTSTRLSTLPTTSLKFSHVLFFIGMLITF